MRPEVIDDEPSGRHEVVPNDRQAGRLAVADDGRGAAEPLERAPDQRAEPARPGLAPRFEQAAEGVEVVAGHDRPTGRQLVDELRVAVIDDVEQVESIAEPARGQEPGVVPVAVQDPVGVPRRSKSQESRIGADKGGQTRVAATSSA